MKGKSSVFIRVAVLVAVLWVCAAGVLWSQQKEYINAIDGNYPPFSLIDKNGNPAGSDVEIVRWIEKEMGIKVKIVAVAWDAMIPSLKAGKIDFVSNMSPTPERLEQVDFTIPYGETGIGVAVRDNTNLNIVDVLSGKYKIGVARGAAAAGWVEETLVDSGILASRNRTIYNNSVLIFKDLANGRIDAGIEDEGVVRDAVNNAPLRIVGIIYGGWTNNFAIRKGDTELKQILDEGIRRLKNSPDWEKLGKNYR
jgi:polar amino acid transport system substrate-binding protein